MELRPTTSCYCEWCHERRTSYCVQQYHMTVPWNSSPSIALAPVIHNSLYYPNPASHMFPNHTELSSYPSNSYAKCRPNMLCDQTSDTNLPNYENMCSMSADHLVSKIPNLLPPQFHGTYGGHRRHIESSPYLYMSPSGSVCSSLNWDLVSRRFLPKNRNTNLSATLENYHLWTAFQEIGNEMIVTKRGRRLFPPFIIKVHGLTGEKKYRLAAIISRSDSLRYRYQGSQWSVQGPAENEGLREEVFYHPDGDGSGNHWSAIGCVSFKRMKLTNKIMSVEQQQELIRKSKFPPILIQTMHKYVMQLVIHEKITDSCPEPIWNVVNFPMTEFIAVTAYQNPKVKVLKIKSNNFARGFRPDGKRSKHDPSEEIDCEEESDEEPELGEKIRKIE